MKLKQAVVAGIGVAPQNQCRPIRELRIGQSVDRKVEDSEIAKGLGFELRFCRVWAQESQAAVRVIEGEMGALSGTSFPLGTAPQTTTGYPALALIFLNLARGGFPIVRSEAERAFLPRVLLSSLLGGCFTPLASLAVIVASASSGLILLPPIALFT